MHLADAFIQSDLHCIQVTVFYILSALALPGNRTHDLGIASTMLYHLSYRKAVLSQALPIDIQHPNEGVLFGGRVQGLIDVLHDPVKEMGVNVFGQGVSGVDRLGIWYVLHIGLGGGHQFPAAQPVLHLLLLYTQQPTEMMQMCVITLQVQKEIVIV